MGAISAVDEKTGRKFYLDDPDDLKPGEPVTFLLNLHGGGSVGGVPVRVRCRRLGLGLPEVLTSVCHKLPVSGQLEHHYTPVSFKLFTIHTRAP